MSTYNFLLYDTTNKEIVYGSAPNPTQNGFTYSDYLFWDPSANLWKAGSSEIHLGGEAGKINQGSGAVAIGLNAGRTNQGLGSIAVGSAAGTTTQAGGPLITLAQIASVQRSLNVATITTTAANTFITGQVVSIQVNTNTSFNATDVPISIITNTTFSYVNSGTNLPTTADTGVVYGTGAQALAIGSSAGEQLQGPQSVAIGYQAGLFWQSGWSQSMASISTVARASNIATIVTSAAHKLVSGQSIRVICSNVSFSVINVVCTVVNSTTFTYPNTGSVVGTTAATGTVGVRDSNAIAIGSLAGQNVQGGSSIAFGPEAGRYNQESQSIAIGANAGKFNQGSNAIAIGTNAGLNNQQPRTIVLNAGTSALNTLTSDACYVNPVRNVDLTAVTGNRQLYISPTSSEVVSYAPVVQSTAFTIPTDTNQRYLYIQQIPYTYALSGKLILQGYAFADPYDNGVVEYIFLGGKGFSSSNASVSVIASLPFNNNVFGSLSVGPNTFALANEFKIGIRRTTVAGGSPPPGNFAMRAIVMLNTDNTNWTLQYSG